MNKYNADTVHYDYVEYNLCKNNIQSFEEKYTTINDLINNNVFYDGMSISFHHHLRNGDYVANMLFDIIEKLNLKNITIVASSIFPVHTKLVSLIKNNNVVKIYSAYISGPVADCISQGYLRDGVFMHSHGTRAHLLLSRELKLDLAFIAAPCVDNEANITGSQGPSSCGVLGYAIADSSVATTVIAITDFIVDKASDVEISGITVDYIVKVDKIGDAKGIVSGTTQITKDPIGLIIARNATEVMKHSGLFRNGFSFQTGAGGISLAVANELKKIMIEENIKGSFASGGITGYLVDMLEKELFDKLYDVQCFDLQAVESIAKNKNHIKMSASKYANPYDKNNIVKDLDFVILGATEIDLNFNVNVTTTSDGVIMGGSGGHSDTAAGAKIAIIVSKLVSSRISVIKDCVTTITTPGPTVDILVTEYGVAINPKHQKLIKRLKEKTNLKIMTLQELHEIALSLTGHPQQTIFAERKIGSVMYRDLTILDDLYKIGK